MSFVFLIFNVLAVPLSYKTLHTGRMFSLFLLLEGCLLAILTAIYVLFYLGTIVILEYAELKEHTHLLEMQSRQYRVLQEHMRQTAQLHHDLRHSVCLLSSLAEKGDIDGIQTHLAGYEARLAENTPANYCSNAALNALFGYYYELAVSADIGTNWHIELPEPLHKAQRERDRTCCHCRDSGKVWRLNKASNSNMEFFVDVMLKICG